MTETNKQTNKLTN